MKKLKKLLAGVLIILTLSISLVEPAYAVVSLAPAFNGDYSCHGLKVLDDGSATVDLAVTPLTRFGSISRIKWRNIMRQETGGVYLGPARIEKQSELFGLNVPINLPFRGQRTVFEEAPFSLPTPDSSQLRYALVSGYVSLESIGKPAQTDFFNDLPLFERRTNLEANESNYLEVRCQYDGSTPGASGGGFPRFPAFAPSPTERIIAETHDSLPSAVNDALDERCLNSFNGTCLLWDSEDNA